MLIYSDIYKAGHISYLICSLILIIVGAILVYKYAKTPKTQKLIIKISGIILLIAILINRFSVTYSDVVINKREGYTWLNLIPNTFCGLSSLVFAFAIILGKKDNIVLHVIPYIGFVGGTVTLFYPDFLETQAFTDIRSISGLVHHTLMVWLTLICMLTKYIKPSMKKLPALVLGLCVIMTFGLIEIDMLGFNKAMQIGEPLLKSAPIFTSWYVVGILLLVLHFIYIVIYERFVNKKTFKEIFNLKNHEGSDNE